MKITLLRHAQTPGNLLSNYIGRTDEPLAPAGIAIAQKAVRDYSVKKVYTSTLARTVQTAKILYPNAALCSLPGLNEMDFGLFEGKSWQELEGDTTYTAWVASRCELPCPDGESKEAFTRRCREAFSSIVRESRTKNIKKLHFVIHGGTIMAIMSGFALPARDYFSWKAGFCGGFVIESILGGEQFSLVEALESPD